MHVFSTFPVRIFSMQSRTEILACIFTWLILNEFFWFSDIKNKERKQIVGHNNLFMKELKYSSTEALWKRQIRIHHLAVGLCDIYNKRVYFGIVDNDIFMFLLSKLPSYNPLWSWVLLKMCLGYGCSYLSSSKWYNDQRRAKFYDPFKVFENDTKWRL